MVKLVVVMMMGLCAEASGTNCASCADLQANLSNVECRMHDAKSQWADANWTSTCEACKAFSTDTKWGDDNACTARNAECKLGQTMWYTRATFETWCAGKTGDVTFYFYPKLAWQAVNQDSLGITQLCADAQTAATTACTAPTTQTTAGTTSNGFRAKCLASIACLVPAMIFSF
jgi:hypothetical protein